MTIAIRVELEELECASCGMTFAIPSLFMEQRRRKHDTFYCPSGHENHYPQKSREEKLAAEVENLRDRNAVLIADRDQAIASRNALRGVVTKQKHKLDRVQAGVCPECRRSFQDLARHMQTKHPHAYAR